MDKTDNLIFTLTATLAVKFVLAETGMSKIFEPNPPIWIDGFEHDWERRCFYLKPDFDHSVGDISNEAYLVLEGSVRIFSADNLLLNRVGPDELFGETSLILGEDRSVNAVAGPAGLTARKVPKTYISNILNNDPVLGAFLCNTRIRLMDPNE
mgnify:CR=1 FL=1